MELNILELLVIVSLIQGALFSIIILTQKKFRVKANKYLAYGILLLVYIGISEFFSAKDLDKDYYFLDFILGDLPWVVLVYYPMFIYFLKSTKHTLAKSKKMILLTIPFFIFSALVCLYHLHHNQFIVFHFIDEYKGVLTEVKYYFAMLYTITLCTISYFVIKSSSVSPSEKKWLKAIWSFYTVLISLWVIYDFVVDVFFTSYYDYYNISYPVWLGVSVFVYWLIFQGLIQLKLSQDKSEINHLLKNELELEKEEDNKSDSINPHYEIFLKLMTDKKLYRNPDLSRDIIAEQLSISTGYLSKVIKNSVDASFTSLVNEYRIKDVKRMLLNPDFDKYSVVAIGLEAGFKSKSAFYNEFKKTTGQTPNQYKLGEIKS